MVNISTVSNSIIDEVIQSSCIKYNIAEYDNITQLKIITNLIEYLHQVKNALYNRKDYNNLCEYITIYLSKLHHEIPNDVEYLILDTELICALISAKNTLSHILRLKFKFQEKYIIASAKYSKITVFLFFIKISPYSSVADLPYSLYLTLIKDSAKNSDNRIFKYMLENSNINFLKYSDTISDICMSINLSNMQDKFIIKRIRLLSNYIDIDEYFSTVISRFKSPKILLYIYKIYSRSVRSYNEIKTLSNHILVFYNNDNTPLDYKIDLLRTSLNKNIHDTLLCDIYLTILYGNIKPCHEYSHADISKIICSNYNHIISQILYNISFSNFYTQIHTNSILYVIHKLLMTKETNSIIFKNTMTHNYEYLLYTRFLAPDDVYTSRIFRLCIHTNLLLHNLRLYAKRIYNNRIIKLISCKYPVTKYLNTNVVFKYKPLTIQDYDISYRGPYIVTKLKPDNFYIIPDISMINLNISAVYYNNKYYLIDFQDPDTSIPNYLMRYDMMKNIIANCINTEWAQPSLIISKEPISTICNDELIINYIKP